MADPIPIPLNINCGYARTVIRELTTTSKAKHQGIVHTANRASDFCQLFDRPTYALPENLFDAHKTKQALFDKNCNFICNFFLRNGTHKLNGRNTQVSFLLKIGKLYQIVKRVNTPYQNVQHVSQSMSSCKRPFQVNHVHITTTNTNDHTA